MILSRYSSYFNLLLCIGIYLFTGCNAASAESVSYLGIAFPVDSLVAVHPNQTKASLGAKTFLAPSKELPRRIASLYAGSPELVSKIPLGDLSAFIVKSAAAGEKELAVSVVHSVLRCPSFSVSQVREIFVSLTASDFLSSLLELAITNFEGAPNNVESICEGFTLFRESARRLALERAPRQVYRFQFQCTEYLQNKARAFLSDGKLVEGMRMLDAISQIFADGSEQFLPLIGARNRLSKLDDVLAQGEYGSVGRMVKGLGEDPWINPFAITLGRSIVQKAMEQATAEGKIANAVRLIGAIDFQRRTPRDHDLVIKILDAVSVSERDVILVDNVSRMIFAISKKDDRVRVHYIQALERMIIEVFDNESLSVVNPLVEKLYQIRPDPSVENDALRERYIGRLLASGQVAQARVMASEMATSVPLALQLKLLLHGAYVDPGILLAAAFAILLALIFIRWGSRGASLNRRPKASRPSNKSSGRAAESNTTQEDDEPQPKRFVVYSHGVSLSQGIDEYADCLKIFALRPGVSLQKIKVAYRNAVKTCHPDLNPNSGEAEATQFISLTRTYERLLQLHEDRTGER